MCRVILKRSLLALPAGASSALFQPLAGPLSRGLIQQRELSCGNCWRSQCLKQPLPSSVELGHSPPQPSQRSPSARRDEDGSKDAGVEKYCVFQPCSLENLPGWRRPTVKAAPKPFPVTVRRSPAIPAVAVLVAVTHSSAVTLRHVAVVIQQRYAGTRPVDTEHISTAWRAIFHGPHVSCWHSYMVVETPTLFISNRGLDQRHVILQDRHFVYVLTLDPAAQDVLNPAFGETDAVTNTAVPKTVTSSVHGFEAL